MTESEKLPSWFRLLTLIVSCPILGVLAGLWAYVPDNGFKAGFYGVMLALFTLVYVLFAGLVVFEW